MGRFQVRTSRVLHFAGIPLWWLVLLSLAAAEMPGDEADPVEDETCLTCHEDHDRQLARGPHQLSSQVTNPRSTVACVSCHAGGSRHVDDPYAGDIVNPAKATDTSVLAVCNVCHQPHTERGTVGFDPHIGLDLNCTSCHRIHSDVVSLLSDDDADFCGRCHVSVVEEFRQRSNHPLVDGGVTCLNCHDFTGDNAPNFGHGAATNCVQCHPERSGPYLFEHEATSSFATEGEGCTACHAPHGSPNERLLVRPNNTLCRHCHGLPAGHRVAHEGIANRLVCMDCHSEVHGSYDNRHLLDPDLGAKIGDGPGSCWCHEAR